MFCPTVRQMVVGTFGHCNHKFPCSIYKENSTYMQLPCNGQNWGSNTPWILGRMSCWRTRTGDGGTPPYGGDGDGGDAGAATWRSLEAVSRETRTERERGLKFQS